MEERSRRSNPIHQNGFRRKNAAKRKSNASEFYISERCQCPFRPKPCSNGSIGHGFQLKVWNLAQDFLQSKGRPTTCLCSMYNTFLKTRNKEVYFSLTPRFPHPTNSNHCLSVVPFQLQSSIRVTFLFDQWMMKRGTWFFKTNL